MVWVVSYFVGEWRIILVDIKVSFSLRIEWYYESDLLKTKKTNKKSEPKIWVGFVLFKEINIVPDPVE